MSLRRSLGAIAIIAAAYSRETLPAAAQQPPPKSTMTFSIGTARTRNVSKIHAIEKLDLGNFNLFNGNTQQAITAYKTALQINPELVEARFGLASCYVRKNKYDLAILECRRILEIKPNHKNSLMLMGNLLKARGQLNEATLCFQKAKQLGVNSVELNTSLGLTLAQSGRLDEANQYLDKALSMSKKHINCQAHLGKGVVCFKQGKQEEALTMLDLAIKEHAGNYAQARNFKAEILYSMGKVDEAKAEYLKEIDKEDPGPTCFQALGNIYLQEENLPEALKIFSKGRKWYPKDADIALGEAVTLEKQENVSEAVTVLKRALPLIKDKNKAETWQKHLLELEATIASQN